jgi:hypothetical protein
MQINIGATNISNLFNGTTTVSVPSFQRNYSWAKDQIEQFLLDIYESAESHQPHFWGPIVLLRLPASHSDLQIIDGQQRITTTMIFLSIVRDKALELPDRIINPGTPGAFDIAPAVRNFIFQPPIFATPRFTGSYMIEDILKTYVLADPQAPGAPGQPPVARPLITPRGAGMTAGVRTYTRELRAAHIQMNKSLTDKLTALNDSAKKTLIADLFTALTTNFEIHTMELTNEDDAYILFESLNDRGLRLNPSDLLKTLTLREVRANPGHLTVDQALTTWDETVANLGEYDFTKFLRHYLLTLTNDKVQSRKIFGEFKKQISQLGPLGAVLNLNQVKAASDHYSTLLGVTNHPDPQLRESFERMNGYSDTHRVFLLGLLQCGLDTQSMRLLTRAIEYLSFRWISAGWNAQELETIYQSLIRQLIGNPTATTAVNIKNDILTKAPNNAAISGVTRNDSANLQRYVLRRIEASTGGAIAGVPNIEHLAPQNPPAGDLHWYAAVAQKDTPDANGLYYDDYVSNWGNLTLLEDKLNKSIQNSPWPQKLNGNGNYAGISASNYNINGYIKTLPGWTAIEILKREQWIATCVTTLLSPSWVNNGTANIAMWNGN